jgi:hypothetical protein
MKKPARPPPVSDEQIRGLLKRYACPIPFHEIRTRFLGNIASPAMNASPMEAVKRLWNDDLPEFESTEAAKELIGALVMGLWNQLARHQERSAPFRLTRLTTAASPQGVENLARVRRQELDGFVEGFFGSEESVDIPERAHRGMDTLGNIRDLFASIENENVTKDETRASALKNAETTVRRLDEMTKTAEHEMHAVVLSCVRARKQMLAGLPIKKPTVH